MQAKVTEPTAKQLKPLLRLASTTNLMPGNLAWQPLQTDWQLDFGDYGDWAQALLQATVTGESAAQAEATWLVIWCWDDLLPEATREDWLAQPQASWPDLIDAWLTPLLLPLRQHLQHCPQRRLWLGALDLQVLSPLSAQRQQALLSLLQQRFDQHLAQLQLSHPGLGNLALPQWLRQHGRQQLVDNRNRYLASCYFSMAGLRLLATWLQVLLQRQIQSARKVLVLDCDNTLWGGVVGEDGLANLQLGQDGAGRAYQDFQRQARWLAQRGVLLALASKNQAEDVWQVFQQHSGMQLKPTHISAAAIDWQPKSQGLQRIAAELGVGLDALVFWDDNPVEREEVRAQLPQVQVVEPPAAIWDWPEALASLTSLQSLTYSQEDQQRGEQYQLRAQAQQLAASLQEGDYLTALQMQAGWQRLDHACLARAEQLCLKTNQFNLNLLRHQRSQLLQAEAEGAAVYLASLQDRFGQHGLTALVLARPCQQPGDYWLDTLVLSCRVLGRRLEEAVLAQLAKVLQHLGGQRLLLSYCPGPRNAPAQLFWQSLPQQPLNEVERQALAQQFALLAEPQVEVAWVSLVDLSARQPDCITWLSD
ncbi:HAD-IIIC family phosphatase [Balneatrix alpica]|uniref:HAD-IIIC family phosphatase n=1 Tax=Balneatrix alpica TaxID=75684 RepID=A0ABV5ZEA1_9GAMM|nr:HAD-IIIC family phosphatase [Balneatrix alpica]